MQGSAALSLSDLGVWIKSVGLGESVRLSVSYLGKVMLPQVCWTLKECWTKSLRLKESV